MDPNGFLIPSFPVESRFIRIGGNFFEPDKSSKKMTDKIHRIIHKHKGPIYLLSRLKDLPQDVQTLSKYDLKISDLEGIQVKSDHEQIGLGLWPIVILRNDL